MEQVTSKALMRKENTNDLKPDKGTIVPGASYKVRKFKMQMISIFS